MNTEIKNSGSVSKAVGYWLITGAVLVIILLIVGGYTRLSHSGLYMVTWKPVTGCIPPMNDAEWAVEFEQYQTSPEYKLRNYHFTLEEFKEIYWPEFYHRVLGRVLGLVFIIPFVYFLIRKKITDRKLRFNLIIIFLLGALQGLVGWLMVASGLVDRPSVSHYRLALHLCTALSLFVYIMIVALPIVSPDKMKSVTDGKKLKWIFYSLTAVVILQIIYGAFVAGLKAGFFYPTWPKMGTEWIPATVTDSFSDGGITNSPYVVQFIHRWLAAVVVIFSAVLYFKSRKLNLEKFQKNSLILVPVVVVIQFVLGVVTLMNLVPVSLGVIHQLGALILLSTLIFVLVRLNYFRV
ncbi:MAG: COX15/CtaA family protein [Crocinitomicaceae bacterium]|nr:COX15/CtaA family protein [Crocinitomicaceae bacterium]